MGDSPHLSGGGSMAGRYAANRGQPTHAVRRRGAEVPALRQTRGRSTRPCRAPARDHRAVEARRALAGGRGSGARWPRLIPRASAATSTRREAAMCSSVGTPSGPTATRARHATPTSYSLLARRNWRRTLAAPGGPGGGPREKRRGPRACITPHSDPPLTARVWLCMQPMHKRTLVSRNPARATLCRSGGGAPLVLPRRRLRKRKPAPPTNLRKPTFGYASPTRA